MHSKPRLITGVVAMAFVLAACGSGAPYAAAPSASATAQPSAYPIETPPTSMPSPVSTGTTLTVASTRLGQILVDSKGRTVYGFLADSGINSSCNSNSCVVAWPPVLTKGAPQAGSGVDAALLGTTTRRDGTSEVTYAGHPLYYFVSDTKAGDLKGQGINAFGGPWLVISPSGSVIR